MFFLWLGLVKVEDQVVADGVLLVLKSLLVLPQLQLAGSSKRYTLNLRF